MEFVFSRSPAPYYVDLRFKRDGRAICLKTLNFLSATLPLASVVKNSPSVCPCGGGSFGSQSVCALRWGSPLCLLYFGVCVNLEDVELTEKPFYIGWGSLNRAGRTIVPYRVICVAQLHGQNQPSIILALLQRDSSIHCMRQNIKHGDLRLL